MEDATPAHYAGLANVDRMNYLLVKYLDDLGYTDEIVICPGENDDIDSYASRIATGAEPVSRLDIDGNTHFVPSERLLDVVSIRDGS